MPKDFSVNRRNPGDWDICVDGSRLFKIRSNGGYFIISRNDKYEISFKTLTAAMVWITDELMEEEICQT